MSSLLSSLSSLQSQQELDKPEGWDHWNESSVIISYHIQTVNYQRLWGTRLASTLAEILRQNSSLTFTVEINHAVSPPSHHKTITYKDGQIVFLCSHPSLVLSAHWPDVFSVEITQQVDLINPHWVVVGVVSVRHTVVRQDHHVHKFLHSSHIKPTFQMNQRGIQLKQKHQIFCSNILSQILKMGQICIIL